MMTVVVLILSRFCIAYRNPFPGNVSLRKGARYMGNRNSDGSQRYDSVDSEVALVAGIGSENTAIQVQRRFGCYKSCVALCGVAFCC
uniref:Putative secreted protein n=1 Tax=Anopheles marajoara TaxID=58244 RepID=A0A2M4CAD7_9DIPT